MNSRPISAREVTALLRGRWHGKYGRSLCPVCTGSKHNPPLSVKDTPGGIAVFCHRGCDHRDIRQALGLEEQGERVRAFTAEDQKAMETEKREADLKSSGYAMQVWDKSEDPHNSLVATYLRSRCIDADALPPSIRFHPACRHAISESVHPAMVALIEGGEYPAIHRTYLQADGSGKAAVSPQKMMLGPSRSGGVFLTPPAPLLVVGEGIETTLSAMQLIKVEPGACFVAGLSTSGIAGLNIPAGTERLIVVVDGDAPGQEAASKLLRRADDTGIHASWIAAPAGADFNDILMEKAHA
jgi:hypothetical protein